MQERRDSQPIEPITDGVVVERRNGRWVWVSVVGTGVAVLVAVVALLGIPNCSELQTKVDAKEERESLGAALRRDLNASVEINAAQHEALGEAIKANQNEIKEGNRATRWMFKELKDEIKSRRPE